MAKLNEFAEIFKNNNDFPQTRQGTWQIFRNIPSVLSEYELLSRNLKFCHNPGRYNKNQTQRNINDFTRRFFTNQPTETITTKTTTNFYQNANKPEAHSGHRVTFTTQ